MSELAQGIVDLSDINHIAVAGIDALWKKRMLKKTGCKLQLFQSGYDSVVTAAGSAGEIMTWFNKKTNSMIRFH